jgi:hypothetical protein
MLFLRSEAGERLSWPAIHDQAFSMTLRSSDSQATFVSKGLSCPCAAWGKSLHAVELERSPEEGPAELAAVAVQEPELGRVQCGARCHAILKALVEGVHEPGR